VHPVVPRSPRVRAFPYPYRGALAFSNDAEFMSVQLFEVLMAWLNGHSSTVLGEGLGLEVTSSMFFYSAHPYSFSFFCGAQADATKSTVAARISEYLRAGWLDTIHAYGDFDQVGGFRREHALRAYEELDRLAVRLTVFTNHGDAHNVQNVGADASYHRGDVVGHPAYHADLMHQHGVRYVWTDSLTTQARARRGLMRLIGFEGAVGKPLLGRARLQDGSALTGFWRFRSTGANAPNLSSLGHQLQQVDYESLYRHRAAVVLYQHFGVLYRTSGACVPATVEAVKERPEVYLAPFRQLAREHHEGRLWIAGLARLLSYVEMTAAAELSGEQDDLVVSGSTSLEGLTIYIDPSRPVSLRAGGERLSLVHNGPDETGRYSVTVPFRKYSTLW
jgi:hypothetical protein